MAFAPLYIGNYVNILHLRIEKWEKLATGAMDITYVGNLGGRFWPFVLYLFAFPGYNLHFPYFVATNLVPSL